MAKKLCPQCRHLVEVSAEICPFCGYEFPEDTNDQMEKTKKNKGCLIIIGLIIAVAIALAVLTAKQSTSDAADTPNTEAVIAE